MSPDVIIGLILAAIGMAASAYLVYRDQRRLRQQADEKDMW